MEVSYANSVIGTVTESIYRYGSTVDAAFVTARGVTLSNRILNGGVIWAASTNVFPENTAVSMYGSTSRLQTGKIITNNYNDIEVKSGMNLGQADYSSVKGDSGGPVLFYEGNYGGETKYTLLGIHNGRGKNGGAIFTHYKNIVNELGVTCLTGSNGPYK